MIEVKHYIDGRSDHGTGLRFGEVCNPSTGAVTGRVRFASHADVRRAIDVAARAQVAWAQVSPQRRARILRNFLQIVERDRKAICEILSAEHGKTLSDSDGDIQRGLEVVEFACGIPHLLKGEYSGSVSGAVDVYSMRQPLGVVAGITPFNFPAMIPMWKFAPAIACGNAMVLKPSERAPSVPLLLAGLFSEAGLPPGVLNVVNGDREAVEEIIENSLVRAIGFVGSSRVASEIYARGCAQGKRVQCFGSAKNHLVVMPDADMNEAVDALVSAAYGAAGERCMAISVAVPVGPETGDRLVSALAAKIEKLKPGLPVDPKADFGPLISREHRERVSSLVQTGVQEGAELVVDGRGFQLAGNENGFFMGGSLFDRVSPTMQIYREEIFGPVLAVVRAESYEKAVELVSSHAYGNGASIFTRSGAIARDFADRVSAGMVGVNVPIPVPAAHHTFGGWKQSAFGDLNQYGTDAIRFYTKTKTVTSRWSVTESLGLDFSIPTAT